MPSAINGFGTTYYGERDRRADGSYITTEWVIAMFVPIVPLRSLRVRPAPSRDEHYGIGSRTAYDVVETRSPDLLQIASIYGFTIVCLATWSALLYAHVQLDTRLADGPLTLWCLASLVIMLWPFFFALALKRLRRHIPIS